MSQTAFFDALGKPQLVPSYCVFADFLGYRHEIRDAARRGDEQEVFRRFMDEIEPLIDATINPHPDDDVPGSERMWDAKVFTDNVVLGYALYSSEGEAEFGHAVTQLMEFQYAVALKGFFVRGGWAFGNLFMNRNTVYGGSLLDAYELENERAVFPRIVLSDDMKDRVLRHMARYGDDPPQIYHLMVDGDGTLFTNYLSEVIISGDVDWDGLHRHAEIVQKRLKDHAGSERVLPKYQWLASYHNVFCELVSGGDGYTDAVKVEGVIPSFGIRQLLHDDSPYVADVTAERQRREERLAKLKESSAGE